jgi:hypothetical protein
LNNRIAFFEQVTNANLLEYRDSTDDLSYKIFVLENALVKKENELKNITKQLNKLIERQVFNNEIIIDKEIYVDSQII